MKVKTLLKVYNPTSGCWYTAQNLKSYTVFTKTLGYPGKRKIVLVKTVA